MLKRIKREHGTHRWLQLIYLKSHERFNLLVTWREFNLYLLLVWSHHSEESCNNAERQTERMDIQTLSRSFSDDRLDELARSISLLICVDFQPSNSRNMTRLAKSSSPYFTCSCCRPAGSPEVKRSSSQHRQIGPEPEKGFKSRS